MSAGLASFLYYRFIRGGPTCCFEIFHLLGCFCVNDSGLESRNRAFCEASDNRVDLGLIAIDDVYRRYAKKGVKTDSAIKSFSISLDWQIQDTDA